MPETDDKERYIVTISDETGNEIRLLMHASSTRMLMALFLKFRGNITGNLKQLIKFVIVMPEMQVEYKYFRILQVQS